MRVTVIGLRSIPDAQGGVETHAKQLYPLLAELGCKVEIVVRSPFFPKHRSRTWDGIQLKRLWAPSISGIEAFLHTFICIIYAAITRPDVLHIHAIGPAIMTPLARILGLNVVVTHHGPDYDREKWGRFAKWLLRTGERLGMKWANQRIVISQTIRELVRNKYDLDSILIPNGVKVPEIPNTKSSLFEFGLDSGKYILQVSRLVPEKRQIDLISAFKKAELTGWKLVLVGKLIHEEKYTLNLISATKDNNNIVLTDFQSGLALRELYAHAGLFVLPSSHEGLPIALLEALSYGLRVIASNIPANLEIGLPQEQYTSLGDINQLSRSICDFANRPLNQNEREKIRKWVEMKYNWRKISAQTLAVYQHAISK